STYFNRTDHEGTPRVSTDYTGTIRRTESNLSFGDGFSETASPVIDYTGFAGGMWDSETNGDHFGAREYAKTQGRWLTPDPAGFASANAANPQTWNRYAYVGNSPLSAVDPSGLFMAVVPPPPPSTSSTDDGSDATGAMGFGGSNCVNPGCAPS